MQRDPRAFLWDVQQAAGAITDFTAVLMPQAIGQAR
jgi:hypothetical protein